MTKPDQHNLAANPGKSADPAGERGSIRTAGHVEHRGLGGRCLFVGLILMGLGTIAVGVGYALTPIDLKLHASQAVSTLFDVGTALRTDIARVVKPAIERTKKLASSKAVIEALDTGDVARLTKMCNDAVTNSTEIDAFALFDRQGKIQAINTVYADGRPIDPERVNRILGMSFDEREIIQRCIRTETDSEALEFQTHCDITPAFFDSTGLSVAYTTPVADPQSHTRHGAASARLRFERLSDLIEARMVGGRKGRVVFVTDQGEYFSESINSGREQPPVSPPLLARIVSPLVRGESANVLVNQDGRYLNLFRLNDFATLENGGIQVMLIGDEEWVLHEVRQARNIRAVVVVLVGVLLVLVGLVLRSATISWRTQRILEQRKRELEDQIRERLKAEADRAAMESTLMSTSRRAGMAEVATNVLHNVGNVLNSVNVSATLVADKLRCLQVSDLVEVTEMMRERGSDLGAFITSDEKGRLLPSYLLELGRHLVDGQGAALQELESLNTNIGHIKDIVNTQQSYARISGVLEEVSLAELVETALRFNSTAMERHKVRVVREFELDSCVLVDKHKVLQVLVNLISNAKHAVESVAPEDRRMTVRIARSADREDFVQIAVLDNGVGIPPENLTRIFAHGFTTKKDGHGFGLHSSALAAKEMGGTLTAHSDGQDQGATFTLEIPLKPAEVLK